MCNIVKWWISAVAPGAIQLYVGHIRNWHTHWFLKAVYRILYVFLGSLVIRTFRKCSGAISGTFSFQQIPEQRIVWKVFVLVVVAAVEGEFNLYQ